MPILEAQDKGVFFILNQGERQVLCDSEQNLKSLSPSCLYPLTGSLTFLYFMSSSLKWQKQYLS